MRCPRESRIRPEAASNQPEPRPFDLTADNLATARSDPVHACSALSPDRRTSGINALRIPGGCACQLLLTGTSAAPHAHR